MTQMNLSTKEKQTHRHGNRLVVFKRGHVGGWMSGNLWLAEAN